MLSKMFLPALTGKPSERLPYSFLFWVWINCCSASIQGKNWKKPIYFSTPSYMHLREWLFPSSIVFTIHKLKPSSRLLIAGIKWFEISILPYEVLRKTDSTQGQREVPESLQVTQERQPFDTFLWTMESIEKPVQQPSLYLTHNVTL